MANRDNVICENIATTVEAIMDGSRTRFVEVVHGLTEAFFQEENFSYPVVFVRWLGGSEFEEGMTDGETGHFCETEIIVKRFDMGASPEVMKQMREDLVKDKDAILDALEVDPSRGGVCLNNWGRGTRVEEIDAEQIGDQAYLIIRLQHEYIRVENDPR